MNLNPSPREAATLAATQGFARLHADYGSALRRITDLILERRPFTQWPDQDRKVLLLAIFPRWSEVERKRPRGVVDMGRARRLLRHLVYMPRLSRAAARLEAMRNEIAEADEVILRRQAEAVRWHLADCCQLWAFRMDPDEECAQ